MIDNKSMYINFCEENNNIPIFLQWWWINSVTNTNWDVSYSLTKDNKIKGVLPYSITKQSNIFNIIKMPKQTQVLGTWISYPKKQKEENKLSFEKEVMIELIENLPKVDYFMQRFHYSQTNWLPFYWKGYNQSTQYTYIIDDLSDLESVYSSFRSNIKTDIKKATKILIIESDNNIEEFYRINKMTFERQNKTIPYSFEFINNLHLEIKKRKQGKIYFAKDKKNNIHAAIYIVWDNYSAYYMWGGSDPKFRNSGATSFLLWQAIQDCAIFVNKFDFEGSMIEPVERFVRSFGTKQIPYNKIYKFNNKFLSLLYKLKELRND